MKLFKTFSAMAFAVALTAPSVAPAADLEYWGEAGGWDVMVDPTLGYGCLIQAEYNNGVLVRIGFDLNEGAAYLTAFHDNWGDIEEGGQYDISFDVDGQTYHGVAKGIYLNGVPGADIYFDSEDFLWDLASKYTLTLYNDYGEVMTIDLDGSMTALEEAIACQDSQ
ncbi:hypothetical protein [Thalassovita sp.]|uniref:hypothetical protein n=1 Tax=Thalassovita sp. TaxID=1979401 RepID=UPI002B278BA4|nr:hypothetical protein [Thalassovita sp.]